MLGKAIVRRLALKNGMGITSTASSSSSSSILYESTSTLLARSCPSCIHSMRSHSTTPHRNFHQGPLNREQDGVKVPISLISKIRSLRPGTPMNLARSALQASSNNVDSALEWIAKETEVLGAKKAEKLQGREARQGLVGVTILSDGLGGAEGKSAVDPNLGSNSPHQGIVGVVRASMVEVRCETDFVARTDEFRELVESISSSLAFFSEHDLPTDSPRIVERRVEEIKAIPVIPTPSNKNLEGDSSVTTAQNTNSNSPIPTIASLITNAISRLGENISLARAVTVSIESPTTPSTQNDTPTYLAGAFSHGGSANTMNPTFTSGRIASLVLFRLPPKGRSKVAREELKPFMRALARQVVALPTTSVRSAVGSSATTAQVESSEGCEGENPSSELSTPPPSEALYDQTMITLQPSPQLDFETGSTVESVISGFNQLQNMASNGEAGFQVIELERWALDA